MIFSTSFDSAQLGTNFLTTLGFPAFCFILIGWCFLYQKCAYILKQLWLKVYRHPICRRCRYFVGCFLSYVRKNLSDERIANCCLLHYQDCGVESRRLFSFELVAAYQARSSFALFEIIRLRYCSCDMTLWVYTGEPKYSKSSYKGLWTHI